MIAAPPKTLDHFYGSAFRPVKSLRWRSATATQYEVAVCHWIRFAGPWPLADVDDILLAEFAAWLLAHGQRPPTVNKTLRHLRAVLRFAARKRAIPAMPEITFLPEDVDPPRAFLLAEIERIIWAARQQPGEIEGVAAADWWHSLILACYDTGGRIGAVLAATTDSLDLERGLLLLPAAAQKNHSGQLLGLHPDTMALVARTLPHTRRLVWPWPWQRDALYRRFRAILATAGVPTWSATGCLFHRLRKSTASYLAAAGGDPVTQLGHSTPRVTARYLDARIAPQQQTAVLLPRPITN